jgi:hypothetical protein
MRTSHPHDAITKHRVLESGGFYQAGFPHRCKKAVVALHNGGQNALKSIIPLTSRTFVKKQPNSINSIGWKIIFRRSNDKRKLA